MGYAVGVTLDKVHLPPVPLTSVNCCVLAYDIEVEFASAANSTSEAPILCVSMKCTCGYHLVVSRACLFDSDINHVVEYNNADIAIKVIKSIVAHMPTFSVGHNIYTYDNKVLAIALPKGHRYRQYILSFAKSPQYLFNPLFQKVIATVDVWHNALKLRTIINNTPSNCRCHLTIIHAFVFNF